MSRNFVLGVDLDGVCGDYASAFKKIVAQERGVPSEELTDEFTWNFPEWGITLDEFTELHSRAVKEKRLFLSLPVYRDASDVLWELSNAGIWIRIITHRLFYSGDHAIVTTDTVQWLDNMNIPYRDICFIGGKQDVGANLYIEDSPSNINAFRAHDCNVIVFDQPYNRDLAGPRARNWQEVKEIVLRAYSQYQEFHTPLPGMSL